MNRTRDLAEFLRARRARLRPEELRLQATARRRVAGLRLDPAARYGRPG
jgi:hypothetical protein